MTQLFSNPTAVAVLLVAALLLASLAANGRRFLQEFLAFSIGLAALVGCLYVVAYAA